MSPNEFKLLCIDRRYRQKDIATVLGVSAGLVSNWWTGRTRISARHLSALAALPVKSVPTKDPTHPKTPGSGQSPIVAFRARVGYSQHDLARVLHVAQGQISRWELQGGNIPGIVRAAIEQAEFARRYWEVMSEEQKQVAREDNPFL